MKGEKIFITGGAGFLGSNIVKRYYNDNEIIVFSRDEAKHYYLKKKFPKIKCIIGDVRNQELLVESMEGATIGIFAASLKQIEAVDQNIEESLQVIIHGAINSRKAAIKNNLKAATFISTDKSRCATTLYGAMKFVAGESFIVNSEIFSTKLSSVVYGNVLNSTGSIIPLIWDSIKNNYSLFLFDEKMTRFLMEVDRAIDSIELALQTTGFTVVPKLQSFRVKDLFDIYSDRFGLKWKKGVPRVSEKIHEQMISPYESTRVKKDEKNNIFLIHYKNIYNEVDFCKNGYSSEDYCMSKEELDLYLEKFNYFKP